MTEILFKEKSNRKKFFSLPLYFSCSATDVIHPSNPPDLVIQFKFFGDILTFCHLFYQAIEGIFSIAVELKKIPVKHILINPNSRIPIKKDIYTSLNLAEKTGKVLVFGIMPYHAPTKKPHSLYSRVGAVFELYYFN